MSTIAEELASVMAQLPPSEQERVLSFARELAHAPVIQHAPLPPGTPGDVVANLRLSPDVADAIERALEDSEQIWPDEEQE